MTPTSAARPYVRTSGDGPSIRFLGGLATVKAGGAETRGRLTVVEFVNPPGFAPPLHRHLREDEMFYVLSGTATFHCEGETLPAGPGDFVLLPVGLPHSFVVDPGEPLRTLQITTPSGFEDFAAEVGEPATGRPSGPPVIDPVALGHAAARHAIEILGPPPGHDGPPRS
ncbi:cupin domain-containing protein [Streptosporangium sp. NPDC048047]|uniref:cupin domain-containing protein n=1 Tax=Streptosporangium sp. NPDC048047 TaxID=3155748 RepID=UPI003418ADF6